MSFIFPTNRELQTIGPAKVAQASAERLGFQILPTRSVNAAKIEWIQKDNFVGLQQLRGLDGAPSNVSRVGSNRYLYNPGVYGEFITLGETELTTRAGGVSTDAPIDVSDLVLEAQDELVQRELDLQEYIIWTLLTTGTFSIAAPKVSGKNGVVFTDTFAIQTANRAVDWDTAASATPLVDFRAIKSTKGAGKGVMFGANARAYMNSVTMAKLLNNTNSADIGGKRVNGGNTVNTLRDINALFAADDLPTMVAYDNGYYSDASTFNYFIPTDKVVIVGSRTSGERVGEYVLTRNMNNAGGAPGSYMFVKDRTVGLNGEKQVPPTIEIHRGHNGGPTLYFPSAICVLSV